MPVALVASVCNQLSFKFLNSVSTKVHENSLQQTRTYLHDTSFHALTSDIKILLQKSTSLNPWKGQTCEYHLLQVISDTEAVVTDRQMDIRTPRQLMNIQSHTTYSRIGLIMCQSCVLWFLEYNWYFLCKRSLL